MHYCICNFFAKPNGSQRCRTKIPFRSLVSLIPHRSMWWPDSKILCLLFFAWMIACTLVHTAFLHISAFSQLIADYSLFSLLFIVFWDPELTMLEGALIASCWTVIHIQWNVFLDSIHGKIVCLCWFFLTFSKFILKEVSDNRILTCNCSSWRISRNIPRKYDSRRNSYCNRLWWSKYQVRFRFLLHFFRSRHTAEDSPCTCNNVSIFWLDLLYLKPYFIKFDSNILNIAIDSIDFVFLWNFL